MHDQQLEQMLPLINIYYINVIYNYDYYSDRKHIYIQVEAAQPKERPTSHCINVMGALQNCT